MAEIIVDRVDLLEEVRKLKVKDNEVVKAIEEILVHRLFLLCTLHYRLLSTPHLLISLFLLTLYHKRPLTICDWVEELFKKCL